MRNGMAVQPELRKGKFAANAWRKRAAKSWDAPIQQKQLGLRMSGRPGYAAAMAEKPAANRRAELAQIQS